MQMTYKDFVQKEEAKRTKLTKIAQERANTAYNKGLNSATQLSPFGWLIRAMYNRPEKL